MLKKGLILLLLVLLSLSLCSPAIASMENENAGVYIGPVSEFLAKDCFLIQDAVSAEDILSLPTSNAIKPTYVIAGPVKWTKGWLSQEAGSWMKAKIVWKTHNGVDSYYFEVRYDGEVYQLTKSDGMFSHVKEVNRY